MQPNRGSVPGRNRIGRGVSVPFNACDQATPSKLFERKLHNLTVDHSAKFGASDSGDLGHGSRSIDKTPYGERSSVQTEGHVPALIVDKRLVAEPLFCESSWQSTRIIDHGLTFYFGVTATVTGAVTPAEVNGEPDNTPPLDVNTVT